MRQEVSRRNDKRLQRLQKAAQFNVAAQLEDIDYVHSLGLKQSTIAGLQSNDWIKRQQNIVITEPISCGKIYLSCVLEHCLCHQGYRVRYIRANRLFGQLPVPHSDGRYLKLIPHIANMELLTIDEWGLESLTQSERNDLMKIKEDRHVNKSAIFASQLSVSQWHDFIADPTLAYAIPDRRFTQRAQARDTR